MTAMIDNSSAQHSETVVSLLVPVYNVEKYVEQCARSIFGQTYPDLEIIFVDDCSPDHSIEIIRRVLEEYPQRKPQTKIIPHTHNQGRAVARQTAMQNCTGYYTIHCDSDDYMAPDAISQLVAKARKEDADITISDIFVVDGDQVRTDKMNVPADNMECLCRILDGGLHSALWNKLVKKSLYDTYHIIWIPGLDEREDMLVMYRLMFHATKIAYVPRPLYYYRCPRFVHSSTRMNPMKQGCCITLLRQMDNFRHEHAPLPQDVEQAFIFHKAEIKILISLYGDRSALKSHKELFREVTIKDIAKHPNRPILHKLTGLLEAMHITPGVLLMRALLRLRDKFITSR